MRSHILKFVTHQGDLRRLKCLTPSHQVSLPRKRDGYCLLRVFIWLDKRSNGWITTIPKFLWEEESNIKSFWKYTRHRNLVLCVRKEPKFDFYIAIVSLKVKMGWESSWSFGRGLFTRWPLSLSLHPGSLPSTWMMNQLPNRFEQCFSRALLGGEKRIYVLTSEDVHVYII